MYRFYSPHASSSTELPADEARHLSRVLRLRAGADVVVFDGQGHEWLARVTQADGDRVTVELVAPRETVAEPAVTVTLAIALLKGDEMDTVVRDATALGVSAIVPFAAARSVVPATARQERAVERWTKVAIASAKQCGRAVVPRIEACQPFERVLATDAALHIVCVEPARLKTPGSTVVTPLNVVVYIGPEGGWTDDEMELVRKRGATCMTLGPRTLRAQTAPTVALATLWTMWNRESGNG